MRLGNISRIPDRFISDSAAGPGKGRAFLTQHQSRYRMPTPLTLATTKVGNIERVLEMVEDEDDEESREILQERISASVCPAD